jgi:AraC-like DNA-binding protein
VPETSAFWRHPSFADLGLLAARFTRHRYALHTHPTYVVALITDGAERIRIGRRAVVAPAGRVAVVNPEEWHDGAAGGDQGWAYRTCYPSVALLQGLAAELGQRGAPLFAPAVIDDPVLARALAAAHAASRGADAVHAETSMLAALRRLILRHADNAGRAEPEAASGARRRVALYEAVIAAHLAARLDLQRLAQAAGVTRFQVIRDFRAVAGLTPSRVIRDRRLRHAGALIAQGGSLAEAASASGFADQSHLSRSFRAAHGITPGAFRQVWRTGPSISLRSAER